MAKRTNRDAVAALIPAPKRKTKVIRVNVTLPEDLLTAIDSSAGIGGRPRFLARAASEMLQGRGAKPGGRKSMAPTKASGRKLERKRNLKV